MTCQIRSDFFLLSSLPCPEDVLCIKQFPEVNQSFSNTGELVLIPLLCGSVPAKLGEVIQMANLVAVHCHVQRFSAYGTQIELQRRELVWRTCAWQGDPFWECATLTNYSRNKSGTVFHFHVVFWFILDISSLMVSEMKNTNTCVSV